MKLLDRKLTPNEGEVLLFKKNDNIIVEHYERNGDYKQRYVYESYEEAIDETAKMYY